MSTIKVNSIESYSGDSINIVNSINFQSVPTGDTVNGLAINSTGGLIISRGGNISEAFYEVSDNMMANDTTSATTSVLVYGVNVFNDSGVTTSNYATKLPEPVTGKSVKVINNGDTFLHIFPSNTGGRINRIENSPIIIPPDGKLYEFICVRNPSPGYWTISTPDINQYDSGDITVSLVGNSVFSFNPIASAVNPNNVISGESFAASTGWCFNGKNKPEIIFDNSNKVFAFRPNVFWNGVTKIIVYTNLTNTSAEETVVRLNGAGGSNYYSPYDDSFLNTGPSSSLSPFGSVNFTLSNQIIGSGAISGNTIYTTANIGDPGTVWGEKNILPYEFNNQTLIGSKELNPIPYPYSPKLDAEGNTINTGDPVVDLHTTYISFQIQPFGNIYDYGIIPDIKFRFIIEYI